MVIHVTRHGQPNLANISRDIDPEIPTCDPPLSELGKKQAKTLGEYLNNAGFNGPVYSSPYRRTLETAQIIAEKVNSLVIPEKAIQEYVLNNGFPDFKGLDIHAIKEKYNYIDRNSYLDYPWFAIGPETIEDVKSRVKPFLDKLVNSGKPEVLLVGHGASVHACKELFISQKAMAEIKEGVNWNCSLSSYKINKDGSVSVLKLFDISHIPEKDITSNNKIYSEINENE